MTGQTNLQQIQQANELASEGKLIEAEALYHQVLVSEPNHPFALYGLAQLAGFIHEIDVKEVLLSQAIAQLIDAGESEHKITAAVWLTELAKVFYQLNRQEDAQLCLAEYEKIMAEI